MYLEQRAEEDTLFAKKYRNPAKNIDECRTATDRQREKKTNPNPHYLI